MIDGSALCRPIRTGDAMALLAIRGIDHINMCVTSLERSVAYYREVFGFEIKEDHRGLEKFPWVTLGIPNVAYLVLYETEQARASRDMRIVHFGFALQPGQKIDDVLACILAARVDVMKNEDGTPVVVHYARSSSIYLKDPDGYAVDISITFGGGLDERR
jgi:catechol 2,3-dioxygenase-like lactoylglutathione lyase family enzyme